MNKVKIIGGGLAGVEAANYLALKGYKVSLIDIKPQRFTPAHKNGNFGELVCSNSLKSNDVYANACGLLKEELRMLGSLTIESGDKFKVPAGNALAVDRDKFAEYITERIRQNSNITCICEEVTKISEEPQIIATGPLTTDKLSAEIEKITGSGLHFYDASAPIISADSIDMARAFVGDRYGKGSGDHINCPMEKEEYLAFYEELINAERATLHEFEKDEVFEGCMPVEVMAARGVDTLRFGPLKPKGLKDPETGKSSYACLQLRKEDEEGKMYNMIGFQTNLKFKEQARVFGMIPALSNAEFLRFGVMHRNTYINAPEVLNADLSVKGRPYLFFAGQLTGVEGYVESAAMGLLAGINMARKLSGKDSLKLDNKTVIGALSNYVATPNVDFQPMNANYGILEIGEQLRDKAERKKRQAERSLKEIAKIKESL